MNNLLTVLISAGVLLAFPGPDLQISVGEPRVIDRYEGAETDPNLQTHHFCGLLRAGNGNLIALYGLLPDAPPPAGVPLEEYLRKSAGYRVSRDGGRTWSGQCELDYAGNNGGTLADGSVVVLSFHSQYVDEHTANIRVHRSRDGGLTWTEARVPVRFPATRKLRLASERFPRPASMYFYGNVLPLGKAELVATMYGQFQDSAQFRAILIRSRDAGRSWEFASTIAGDKPSGHGGFTEPTLARLANGELLCVMRTEYHEPRILVQARSADGVRTWGEPVPAPGIPGVGPADREHVTPDGARAHFDAGNVSPMLARLENGVLAMVYGRPGLKLAVSFDGSGRHWDKIVDIVPNAYPNSYSRGDVTSGMAGLAPVGPNELVLVSDIYSYATRARDFKRNTIFARRIRIGK